MATLLYYIPERPGAPDAGPPAVLARMEAGRHVQTCTGPDGGRGQLLAAADRIEAGRVRYRPAEQRWQEVAGEGYWIGVISDEIPRPADLLRSRPLPGHLVTLADGQGWLCPVARGQAEEDGRLVWYHALPRSLARQADGSWAPGPVVPRWARLWQIAGSYWEAKFAAAMPAAAGETVVLDFSGSAAAACECLAVNYRLTPVEIDLLGLLDTESPRRILDALIDLPTLLELSAEMEKKTAGEVSAP